MALTGADKVTMSSLRLLLLPFAWLYGGVLRLRHALYDIGSLRSHEPSLPTIVIGNLALGGTGKTPMMELVLDVLGGSSTLATLSRGYGRRTNDLREVATEDEAVSVGDEPLQVKRKFPSVHVFVGADRVAGIEAIQQRVPQVRTVVLDDAFQHRRLQGSLNILLTTYHAPWHKDHLLPAGRLRDVRSRRTAAHIVVVTKCPAALSTEEQKRWRTDLGLSEQQHLYFSGITYQELRQFHGPPVSVDGNTACLLFTGIADPSPLVQHVRAHWERVEHVAFPDHHPFGTGDLERLAERYATFAPGPKMLVTTEKDAMRLRSVIASGALRNLPVYTIGMKASMIHQPEQFAAAIRDHVATHPTHR